MSYTEEKEIMDISDKEFKEKFLPFYDNFNDYILDINSKGISIWEGGLRAYSDKAGELLSDNQTPFDTIYGYKEDVYENPLPYFNLVEFYKYY